jgi:uncharacterized protein (TIGR02996 family)
MEEHEPFITAIESQPGDHITRLVYADWLDERNHPAGAYLRTELQLASLPKESELAPDLRAKLRTLRQQIEPAWLARFDQPRVLLANPTPFPAAWWGIDLPEVRDFDSTYSRFPYDTLPPLRHPRLTGRFDWLPKPTEEIELFDSSGREARYTSHFVRLIEHLAESGLSVPADLKRWMSDSSVRRVPSCTDCYTYRPWDVAPVEDPPGSRVLPFYIDSQGCVTWYVYFAPEGYHAVVASNDYLCSDWDSVSRENPDAPLDHRIPPEEPVQFFFVAPSVEVFFYRWWLENRLWDKLLEPQSLHDSTGLTPEEQAYIDFYRQHPTGKT